MRTEKEKDELIVELTRALKTTNQQLLEAADIINKQIKDKETLTFALKETNKILSSSANLIQNIKNRGQDEN